MNTQVSQNFDIREFVCKRLFALFGINSTWFINPKMVNIAEFYKTFFTHYFKKKYGNDKVVNVLIRINNWHTGGSKQWSGVRLKECEQYKEFSQHSFFNGFDCEIIIVFKDGTQKEVDYKEIHEVIQANEAEFMANGVTCIESIEFAPGWLHTDGRWIPNQKHILIVKTSNK